MEKPKTPECPKCDLAYFVDENGKCHRCGTKGVVPTEPTITITEKEYRDLCRSADALDWLAGRGICWRGVDAVFPGWRVGDETEWHYANHGDIRDMVDNHRRILKEQKP